MNLPRTVARAAGNAATAVTKAAVNGVGLGHPHRNNTGNHDRTCPPPTTPALKDTATAPSPPPGSRRNAREAHHNQPQRHRIDSCLGTQ